MDTGKERFCRSFFVLQKKNGIVGKAADAEGIPAGKGSAGGETPVLDKVLGKDIMDGLRGGPEGAVDRNRANGMMEGSESPIQGKVNQDIYGQNAQTSAGSPHIPNGAEGGETAGGTLAGERAEVEGAESPANMIEPRDTDGAIDQLVREANITEGLSESRAAEEIMRAAEPESPAGQETGAAPMQFADIPEKVKQQAADAVNGRGSWLELDAKTRKTLTDPQSLKEINEYFGLNISEKANRNDIQNALFDRWCETSGKREKYG